MVHRSNERAEGRVGGHVVAGDVHSPYALAACVGQGLGDQPALANPGHSFHQSRPPALRARAFEEPLQDRQLVTPSHERIASQVSTAEAMRLGRDAILGDLYHDQLRCFLQNHAGAGAGAGRSRANSNRQGRVGKHSPNIVWRLDYRKEKI